MDSLTKMQFLWTAAHEVLEYNPALSSFYLSQIQSDKNVSLSKSLLKRFCTHCSTLFIPGVTCKVEIKSIKTKKNKKNFKEMKAKRKEWQGLFHHDDDPSTIPDSMEEDEPSMAASPPKPPLYYSLDDKHDTFQYYKYANIIKYTCNICRTETIFNGSQTTYQLEKPSLETIDEEMEINLSNTNKSMGKRAASVVNSPINSPIPNHYRTNSNSSTSSLSVNANRSSQNKSSKKRKRNKNDLQQLLSKSNENKKPKTYSLNDFLSNL